jgi:hypothetical protein
MLLLPCAVLSLPTRTADGSAIYVNAEHCLGLQKQEYTREAIVVEAPSGKRPDGAFLLQVRSSQLQKVRRRRRRRRRTINTSTRRRPKRGGDRQTDHVLMIMGQLL